MCWKLNAFCCLIIMQMLLKRVIVPLIIPAVILETAIMVAYGSQRKQIHEMQCD